MVSSGGEGALSKFVSIGTVVWCAVTPNSHSPEGSAEIITPDEAVRFKEMAQGLAKEHKMFFSFYLMRWLYDIF